MTLSRFLGAGALGALAAALAATATPVLAQDDDAPGRLRPRAERVAGERGDNNGSSELRAARAQARAEARSRPAEQAAPQARSWGGGSRQEAQAPRWQGREDRSVQAPAAATRDGSYGANARNRDWAAQRQARDSAAQQQRSGGSWATRGDRRDSANTGNTAGTVGTSGWQRDRSYGANTRSSNDWQRDRRQEAARAERRDDARNYASGYRDGRRADNRYDNRYGQNHRRWDNRGWRNDNRYDWYRYRAANRSIFSIGRYYAPYRGYSYSRLNIGFRLGSLFYSNRYWINDPWRYRLPDVYGPYRWVRYYDDALLVDIYSGEVVDVIHDFFW